MSNLYDQRANVDLDTDRLMMSRKSVICEGLKSVEPKEEGLETSI